MTDHYGIITFNSTHHAIAGEKRLLLAGFAVRIIPVPTQVTADCGLAIRFALDNFQAIHPLLKDMDDTGWYEVQVEGRKKEIHPIYTTNSHRITIYLQHYPPCPVKEKHAKEHRLGRELLALGLKELFNLNIAADDIDAHIAKTEHEKPYLKDYPNIHFNISHCDELVACAFSSDEIGFDIEHIVDFSDSILRRVLTDDEKEYLRSFKSDEEKYKELFCRFWTLKESRIKHAGMGLAMPMTDFSFTFDFETEPVSVTCSESDFFFYQECFEKDYFFSICTGTPQEYRIIVL